MSNIRINSTFSLRGINPKQLHDNYLNGVTNNITLDQFSSKSINQVDALELDYPIGDNQQSEIYEHKDTNNIRIFTTNHSDYIKVINNGKIEHNKSSTNNFCRNCEEEIIGTPIGIPFYMEVEINESKIGKSTESGTDKRTGSGSGTDKRTESDLGIESNDNSGEKYNKEIVFYTEDDKYCCFECMLPYTLFHTKRKYSMMDVNYKDVDYYTRIMFRLMYPDKDFPIAASEANLLKSQNGPLKMKDYKKHKYIPIPGLIFSPVKRRFVQYD